jgi:hypothetical protein
VEDFNAPLSSIYSHPNKEMNKEILELNVTIDLMDLTDIYRIFNLTAQYTFFKDAQGSFSKIDGILGHKATLSKYNKTEIIPCILSDHSALKLELSYKSNSRKYVNNWRLITHCSTFSVS